MIFSAKVKIKFLLGFVFAVLVSLPFVMHAVIDPYFSKFIYSLYVATIANTHIYVYLCCYMLCHYVQLHRYIATYLLLFSLVI